MEYDDSHVCNKYWKIIIHRKKKRKLAIITNDLNTPFITGDQPAINIKKKEGKQQDELSIYYPISPNLALILCDINQEPIMPENGIQPHQVDEVNKLIANASHKQIFSNSKEYLNNFHYK
ncbi:DUF4238 domain-containing protein [Aquitalea sp. LB_tupeE]|uniref:DUF4238 domain-containing protein n=1 Tax=Aquitalea sp. LB_tupeE TaxID=2748078 RepID=UPI0015B97F0A|nr:DUF4238 domain-containing protein [Aquitalea sp. LB_tupeE]